MASSSELVEAQAYTRRRLVTAFVTGTVDGSVEVRSPWRALVVGLLLAGALVGGCAAAPWVREAMSDGAVARATAALARAEPAPRRSAEDRGFEPLRALTQPAFQASAIGH